MVSTLKAVPRRGAGIPPGVPRVDRRQALAAAAPADQPFPDQLWDIRVGLGYRHEFDNGWIAGVNFENIWDQGANNLTNVSQRHQYATMVGGAYRMAPGLQLIAEYAYQYRHQGNFNFATGVAGTGTRDAQAQGFMVGTVLSW